MIGAGAFSDCSEMTSITLPNTIKAIGMNAFSNCNKLSSITFPNSVTDIADRAFDNCSGLTSVKFEGTACQYAIDTDAFWGIGSPSPIELILPDDWNYDAARLIIVPLGMVVISTPIFIQQRRQRINKTPLLKSPPSWASIPRVPTCSLILQKM